MKKQLLDEDIMYNKIISGECKVTFTRNISDIAYKNGLLKIFDRGILPFMIATRFRYTSVEDVYNSTEKFSIVNKNRSAKSLLNKFLYDKCKDKGNSAFNNFPFKDILNNPEFSNYIDTRMNYYKKMENYGKLNWKDINYYENCEVLKKYFSEYSSSSTPLKLINKMVDDIFEPNGFIKYFDPCCGRGMFLYSIKNKLIEYGYNEDYAMSCIHGQDSNELLCFVAQSILDPEGKYKTIIKCADTLEFQGEIMKHDVIIGNPPYNKGIIDKRHSCYTHEAMDKTREGHIGFYIKNLEENLSNDGVLTFITPGKFLAANNSYNTRKWLFENYNVEKINFYHCKDVFPTVDISSIISMKISNGITENIEITTPENDIVLLNPNTIPDMIVPRFNYKIQYDIWNKMVKKDLFFPKHKIMNVGKYGENKNFNKTKDNYFCNRVLTEIKKGIPKYEYTNLKSNYTGEIRIAAKEADAAYFTVVDKGVETNHTFYSFFVDSIEEAKNIIEYTKTDLFEMLKTNFYVTYHVGAWINYIPMYNKKFDNVNEIYNYYNFTNEEKTFIDNYFNKKKIYKEKEITSDSEIERDKNRINNTGEVFTPKWMVNEMLDVLPTETWSDPDKTFLEPSCGDGNFLIEIFNRLMNGLKEVIPDEYERKKHIIENQIYAIDLMKDNVEAVIKRLDIKDFDHNIVCNDALIFDFSKDELFEIDYYDIISKKNKKKKEENNFKINSMFEF